MAERSLGQLSLADSLVAGAGRNATLERLDELIDWSAIARLLSPVHGSRYGAPGYPAVVMLKGIAVAAWMGCCCPWRRRSRIGPSFRRFRGFGMDAETLERLRRSIASARRCGSVACGIVSERSNRQISSSGLIVRQGMLIDASLVDAVVKRLKPLAEQRPAELVMLSEAKPNQASGTAEVKERSC